MNIYLTIVQEFALDNFGIPTALAIEHDNITVAANENDALENHIDAVKLKYYDDETFCVSKIEHSVMNGFPMSSIIEQKVPGDNKIIIIETIKKETK